MIHLKHLQKSLIYRHIYGGSLSNLNFDETSSLLLLADKYNMKGLVRICSDTIMEILQNDSSSIVEAAILGHRLNKKQLVDAAMKSMTDFKITYNELEDWEKLQTYPKLMGYMLDYCTTKLANF